MPAAIFAATVTLELIIVRSIAHGVIEIEFLAGVNVAHGDQSDLTGKANIRLAGMIEAIGGFQRQGRFQIISFFDLENTLGEGIVSGLRKRRDVDLVQTTAPISPGSSGGGLFDASGNLIGITTFLLRDGQNLNFAIAADTFWK